MVSWKSRSRYDNQNSGTQYATRSDIKMGNHEQIVLRIENLSRYYENNTALDDVTLNIQKGEIFALLGGSGAGKSTLLKIVAGFDAPSTGRIYLDGKDITSTPPYHRSVNMMFQNYALFPHMSVKKKRFLLD